MIREALSHLHWSTLPVVSMFMFAAVFVGVLFWVNRKASSRIYREMENLPLDNGTRGGQL
jgi:hypothetical protein